MQIDFNDINELTMPGMNNGTGQMTVRMYNDDKYRIIPTIIHAGGSIGLHTQNSGDDLNYIISGTGKAICDGVEEKLSAGVMHICPKGSEHTIINTGDDNLVMLTTGDGFSAVSFLLPFYAKMLKNGLNTEVLISLIIKLDFFR